MSFDTQSEILAHLGAIQKIVRVCEGALLDGVPSPEMALDLRQRIEGATRRLQMVRDWLDHVGD